MRRNPPELHPLESPSLLVVLDEVALVQHRRRRVYQIYALLLQVLVFLEVLLRDSIQARVSHHADVQYDLCIEVICELRDELGLDGQLSVDKRDPVLQFRVRRDDDALAVRVVLRPSRAAHHLEHVLRAQLDPATFLRRINLRALDDDGVRGQVDTPGERCGGTQNAYVTVSEQLLDKCSVRACHARVVDGKAVGEEVGKVWVFDGGCFRLQDLPASGVLAEELHDGVLLERHIADGFCGLCSLLS
ncbi:hypothetical protein BC936DRAFT_145567 [Jimgerdemannia flammicorona]|uniref:Uncharacterized protein n=1 Tax=Jimgerdemannia flammicorona TaxID=994334 RepID=A0A433DAD7_9FUNG|nr:hypothetical protein BC936DRAFT_145567 [Jimgerdemannia flammicorona]